MYKCRECGAKYETKPDYCECGNDTFVRIMPNPKPISGTKAQTEPVNIKMIKNEADLDSGLEDFRSFDEPQTSQYTDDFNKLSQPQNDRVSMGIFAACIFLAFLVLFFIGNPKKSPVTTETVQETTTLKDIPSLESFWDNTPIKIQTAQTSAPEEKPTVEIPIVSELPKIVQQIIPQQKTQTTPKIVQNSTQKQTAVQNKIQTTTNKNSAVKTNSNTINKTAAANNAPKTNPSNSSVTDLMSRIKNNQTTSQQTQAPKQAASGQQSASNTNTQNNNTTSNSTKTASVQQNTSAQQTTAAQVALEVQQKAAAQAQAAKEAAAAKQELANYKSSLRNAIGRKIDFTSVVGDGTCSLSFKINSSGRLINRTFTKQSSNLTLNEAVYSAMNATPSYNPPPSAYKNETLNLTIKFYNGNFEISLN